MNKKRMLPKKIAAWFLCLAMVLTTINLPAFSTKVKAESDTSSTTSYLTFTAEEANATMSFNWSNESVVQIKASSTNVKIGEASAKADWQDYEKNVEIILPSEGDSVAFRGVGVVTDDNSHFTIKDKKIAASGDVTSLTNNEGGDTALTVEKCYRSMFSGCASLSSAPKLPSTTLVNNCYQYMFKDCASLSEAPELPAMTLKWSCYQYMFSGCTSLSSAPELPATALLDSCYGYMFAGCTSLSEAPELPATILPNNCYSNMFYNCKSLRNAPKLSITTLNRYSCTEMFYGCVKLKVVECSEASEATWIFPQTEAKDWNRDMIQALVATGSLVKVEAGKMYTVSENLGPICTGSHKYNVEFVEVKAKKSDATCTEPAKYYKSCSNCGKAATDRHYLFDYGEPLGHDFLISETKHCCQREGCAVQGLHDFMVQKDDDFVCKTDVEECSVCGVKNLLYDGLTVEITNSDDSGSMRALSIVIKNGDVPLVENIDYEVAVTKCEDSESSYVITITGKDAYVGTINKILDTDKIIPTRNHIIYTAPTELVYDDTAKEASLKVKEGLEGFGAITTYYKLKGSDEPMTTVAPKNAGTYEVYAEVAEGENYNASFEKILINEFTIAKATSSITVEASVSKSYGDAAFSLNATTTGDGTLTYSSDDEAVATVDTAGKVTITGDGTAIITVSVPATNNCNAAEDKTVTLTVAKGTLVEGTDYTIPKNLTADCGDLLSSVELGDSMFTWKLDSVKLEAGEAEEGSTIPCEAIVKKAHYEDLEVEVNVKVTHLLSTIHIAETEKHALQCSTCKKIFNETACSGGTATCTTKAKCSVCEAEYGEVDSTNHSYTTYTSDNDATCLANGHKTAICDNGCGSKKIVEDEGSKLGHNYANGICIMCKKAFSIVKDGLVYTVVTAKMENEDGSVSTVPKEVITKDSEGKDVRSIAVSVKADEDAEVKGAITIPATVTNEDMPFTVVAVEENAFAKTEATSITLPETVTKVGAGAFASETITEVAFTSVNAPAIDEKAFVGSKVTKVTVPEGAKDYDTQEALKSETIKVEEDKEPVKDPGQKPDDSKDPEQKPDDSKDPGQKPDDSKDPEQKPDDSKDPGQKPDDSKEPASKPDDATGKPDSTTQVSNGTTEAPADDKKPGDTTKVPANAGDTVKDDTGVAYTVADADQKTVVYTAPAEQNVKSIKVPDTVTINGVSYAVTEVAPNAFSGCTNLKSITIGKNVTSIGANAFKNCKALTKLTIPAKVAKIGANAFSGCKKLKTLTIKNKKLKAKDINKKAFKGLPKNVTIKVPKKQLKAYKKLFKKKGFKGKVK